MAQEVALPDAPPIADAGAADPPRSPRRYAEPVASWVALGLVMGFVGPTSAVVGFELPAAEYAPFVVGSTVVGALGGLALGIVDPPGRLLRPGLPIGRALLRGALAVAGTAILGLAWTGTAGAVGGAAFVGVVLLVSGGSPFFSLPGIALWGALLGLGVGGPIVALFGLARSVGVALGAPGLASFIAVVALPLLGAVLGRVVFAAFFGV